jgi:small-conductance mechanosensitive channel
VIALMREAASHPRRILSSPPPNVLILSFSETAIELEVRFWIADAQNGVHNVKSEVLYEVWKYSGKRASRFPTPSGICMSVPPVPIETDCLLALAC